MPLGNTTNTYNYYDVAIYIVLDIYRWLNEIFMMFIVAVTYK